MDEEKFTRNIALLCPTCGCDQFEVKPSTGEHNEITICASCKREMTKDTLLQENGENIAEHVKEIKTELISEVEKEFKNMLKNAFQGNKNIRIN